MSIILTELAASKIKQFAKADEIVGKPIIRVGIKGGGCVGFETSLEFEKNEPRQTDKQFEQFDVKIVVDPMSYSYLQGVEIDYVHSMSGSGFKFNNLPFSKSCSCGKSYGF